MTAVLAFPPMTAFTERQWAYSREFLARRVGCELHPRYPYGASQDQKDKLVELNRTQYYYEADAAHLHADRLEREARVRRIDEELDRVLGPALKKERVLEQ